MRRCGRPTSSSSTSSGIERRGGSRGRRNFRNDNSNGIVVHSQFAALLPRRSSIHQLLLQPTFCRLLPSIPLDELVDILDRKRQRPAPDPTNDNEPIDVLVLSWRLARPECLLHEVDGRSDVAEEVEERSSESRVGRSSWSEELFGRCDDLLEA